MVMLHIMKTQFFLLKIHYTRIKNFYLRDFQGGPIESDDSAHVRVESVSLDVGTPVILVNGLRLGRSPGGSLLSGH